MPPSELKAIEVTDLTVAYQDKPVLWDIDLDVPPGVLLSIVGPNGAGKTTLIKAILGLVRPAAGNVLIYDKPYDSQRRIVGYVPQRGSVDWDFPTNVLDVVMMGRYGALGWVRLTRKERTRTGDACPGKGRYGSVYYPPNQSTLWWPTTTRFSCPRTRSRCYSLFDG